MSIDKFHNKHVGETIFVCGSGPSLHFFDTKILESNTTVCVNGSILKHNNPDYYLTSDGSQTLKHHWEYVVSGRFPIIAGSMGASDHIRKYGRFELVKDRLHTFQKVGTYKIDPNSSTMIFGYTSTHCALHFAFFCGASKVVLVGCDCSEMDGKKYFYDFPGEEKDFVVLKDKMPRVEELRVASSGMYGGWLRIKNENKNLNIQAFGGLAENIFPKYKYE